MKKTLALIFSGIVLGLTAAGAQDAVTKVGVSLPQKDAQISPMIYGQMFEDCNDKVIYGGLIKKDGTEHEKVRELLKPLDIPIMRWPAGTYIHEYDWKKGIGPMESRVAVGCHVWGGADTNQFGTDEFLQWCERMEVEPYINFNMGNDPKLGGSLGEALDWIEYCNGDESTVWGKRRAANGRAEPYKVKYWCIGNENYGPWGKHTSESAEVYAAKLKRWAQVIRFAYPDLKLLGVGHKPAWNEAILNETGNLIDIITLHYYVGARVRGGKLEQPQNTLFTPEKVEANIARTVALLEKINEKFGREKNPVTISIDEWNCRHSVFDGEKWDFTRNDPRRLFDVATAAGMLNAFIRQSPAVSMANYIFPVNGHGLIRTAGEKDAYKTILYYVFEKYRKTMLGKRLDVAVDGPKSDANPKTFSLSGDFEKIEEFNAKKLTFIDSAAALDENGRIQVSLINRSHDSAQEVLLELPDGYAPVKKWELSSGNINEGNVPGAGDAVLPKEESLDGKKSFTLSPCALLIIECEKR